MACASIIRTGCTIRWGISPRLQEAGLRRVARAGGGLYLLVEKILASFERLPRSWPVHGTTGYNFANIVNGLFVDARAKSRLDRIYRSFIIDYVEWAEVATESAAAGAADGLAAELNVLANQLARIAQADRHTRDFTLSNLRQALMEVIARFPVYRTYVGPRPRTMTGATSTGPSRRARRHSSLDDIPLFEFINAMLLAEAPLVGARAAGRCARVRAQVPAGYRAGDGQGRRGHRAVSLHATGVAERSGRRSRRTSGPASGSSMPTRSNRARNWPHEMLGTSTHDTKRSEDVRVRISVLSGDAVGVATSACSAGVA